MAEHVFVETNWVIDCVAPTLAAGPAALELLARAGAGDLVLDLPTICLIEAKKVVRERNVRDYTAAARSFIRARRGADRRAKTNPGARP